MSDLNWVATVNSNPAIQSLNRIQDKVQTLESKFSGFASAIAAIGIGAAISNTIRYADALQDLADSTNIATSDLLEFQKAVELSGGTSESAQQSVSKLTLSIDEASRGGKNVQQAFNEVGVSLNDLRNLSEKDILQKTVEGLSKITDAGKRATLAQDLLGKSARNLNYSNLSQQFGQTSLESIKAAENFKKLADFQDKLSATTQKLRESLAATLGPLVDKINQIPQETLNKIVESFIQLSSGIALLAASIAGIKQFITVIGALSAAVGTLYAAYKTYISTLNTAFAIIRYSIPTLKAHASAITAISVAFRALASGGVLLTIIITFGKLIALLTLVAAAFYAVNEVIRVFTGNSLVEWATKGITYLGDLTKQVLGLGDGIESLRKRASTLEPMGDIIDITDLPEPELKKPKFLPAEEVANELKRLENLGNKQKKNLREVNAYYDQQVKLLKAGTEQFKRQGEEIVKNLRLQYQYNGLSEDTVEIITAQNDAYKRAADEIQKLKDQRALLKPEEKELAKLIDEQIVKIERLGHAQANQATNAIQNLQAQRDAQDRLNHALEMKSLDIGNNENLLQLQEQLSLVGQYGDVLENNLIKINVERELRSKLNQYTLEQIDLENKRAKLGEENFNREMAQLEEKRQAAIRYAEARITEENKIAEARRKSEREDVTGIINKRLEEIQRSVDPTVIALQKINSVFDNMGSAIDNFVKTGKFKFKDFALSIIQDLISIELKAQATKIILDLLKSIRGGAGGGGGRGNIFSSIFSFLGFANGGQPPMNKLSLVGEKGPELFMPKQPGTIIPNDQLGNMGRQEQVVNNYYTYNVSAIDSKSVAQFFAEHRRTMLGTIQLAQKEMPYSNV